MNALARAFGLALAGLIVLYGTRAEAGYRITYELVSYSEEDDTPEVDSRQKNILLVDDGKMRTVGGDAEGLDLIANLNDTRIYVLDATQKAYAQIEFPALATAAADTESADPSGTFQIEVEDSAMPVMGYAARRYLVYDDSNLIREIVTTEDMSMGFDYMRVPEGLQRAYQEFAPAQDFSELSLLYRQVRGVPLTDINYYPRGKDVLHVKKVERVKFRAEDFLPPKNYEKKTLKALSETGVPESESDTQSAKSSP